MIRRDNLKIPQGSEWAVRWPLRDNNDKPIPSVGWTVRAQIRRRSNSPEILHEWSSELGNAFVENSIVILTVSSNESSAWNWRNGVFDVELMDAEGHVVRMTEGTVTVSPEVTR